MKKTIGVLGSGNWGTTLANLIAQRGQSVLLWSRNPSTVQEINHSKTNQKYTPGLKILDSIHATSSMKEVAESCELIFVVVPSKVFREVSQELGTYVSGDQILVSGTKGIENKTFRMMCDILKEETDKLNRLLDEREKTKKDYLDILKGGQAQEKNDQSEQLLKKFKLLNQQVAVQEKKLTNLTKK